MGYDPSKYEKILGYYSEGDHHHHHHDDDDHDWEDRPDRFQPNIAPNTSDPKRLAFRTKLSHQRDALKEDCHRKLLLDIYLRVLPMDDGCAEGNVAKYSADIDNMLSAKGMTATQYFRSAAEATKAPLLEFVNSSVDAIAQSFMEKAEEEAEEAEKEDIDLPDSKVDEEEIDNQLVEVQKDTEYEDFIDKLKKKTIKKIVSDISALISDKKDEKDMTFAPQTESAFCQSIDYITTVMAKANCEPDLSNDHLMELAVRESTLFALNECFACPDRDLGHFRQGLGLGRGLVLTESSVLDVCSEYGLVELPDPLAEFEPFMLENSEYLDSLVGEVYSEGVIGAIGKGIKWLIDHIISLLKRLKDTIVNIFRPRTKKQIERIETADKAISDSFKAAGISRKSPTVGAVTSLPKDTGSSKTSAAKTTESKVNGNTTANSKSSSKSSGAKSASTPKSVPAAKSTAASAKTAAGSGDPTQVRRLADIAPSTMQLEDKRGLILKTATDLIVHLNPDIQVIELNEYLKRIREKFVKPLTQGYFDLDHPVRGRTVREAKEVFHDDGRGIPVIESRRFNVGELFDWCDEGIKRMYDNMRVMEKVAKKREVDPFVQTILTGIYLSINSVNNLLNHLAGLVTIKYQNPFNDEDLAALNNRKLLGRVVEHIIVKGSREGAYGGGGPFLITQPLIRSVAKYHGWISDTDDAKAGASRIAVLEKNTSRDIYKYAWNMKGIIDNKKDLELKAKVTGKSAEISEMFAFPTDESAKSGAYLVVPRAKPVDSSDKARDLGRTFDELANKYSLGLKSEDPKAANVGMLNGKLVFIDYGNFIKI